MIIGAPHPYRHGKPWLIATVTALLLALSTAACGKKKSSDDAEPATEAPVTPPTGGDQPGTDDGGSGGDGGAGDPDPVVKPPKPVVPSATYSEIEVSAPSVAAGQAVTLKVVAMSAANVPYTQGGATVAFSRTGGTSNGSISAVTDHGDGTYTAVFSATTAGTATTINALFNGKPITTTAPTVTVTYGAVSAANSVLLSDLSVIASGDIAELTLTTYDAHGNAVTSGGAAVTLGHAGGTSTGNFGTITDNGDGSYSAFFTGVTAGSATSIIAEIDGQPIGGAPVAITVLPGAVSLAQSSVSVSDATVQAGATSTLTLTARDDAGNQLTSGGLTASLSYAGGSSTGSIGSVTDNGDGTYTATFTAALKGSPTSIEGMINGFAVLSAAPTITVSPGPVSLADSVVSVSNAAINAGQTSTLTLTAYDAYGNQQDGGGDTVVFSHSGGTSTGVIGATTDNNDGTYQATFTGATKGTATSIGATVNAQSVTSAAPTITVSPGAASRLHSQVSVSDASIQSGSISTLTLTVFDAYGNQLDTGGATVAFSRSGGSSTGIIGSTTDANDGTYTAAFTGVLKGTATSINATLNGQLVTTASPTVTVTQGPLSLAASSVAVSSGSVIAGNTVNVTLTARDAAGNQFAAGGETVAFSLSGGTSAGAIAPTTDNGNGTYTAVFTGETAGSAASVQTTIGGSAVTHAAPTITVTPGPISLTNSIISVSNAAISAGQTSTLTLTAFDAYGNQHDAGGQTVVFSHAGGTSTGTIGATTDNNDGTYQATFTGATKGTATTIGATVNAQPVTSTAPTITVSPGAASRLHSVISVSSTSIPSGSVSTLTLTVLDAYGNQLDTGGATVAFSRSGGTSTGVIGSTTDANNGTYTAAFTGVLKGTATSINATLNGQLVTTASPTITVTQGPLSLAASSVAVSSGSVIAGNTVNVTLTARDAAGNQFAAGGETVAFSLSGGTSAGAIDPTTDNGNGTYTAVFTGETAGSAASVQATIGGSAVTHAAPTITVTPGAFDLDNSSIATTDDSIVSGESATVTLTARDSYGNQLTSGGLNVTFSMTGGSSTFDVGSVVDNANGTYSAVFGGLIAGTPVDVVGAIGGNDLSSASVSMVVLTGPASTATSEVSLSAVSVASGDSVTVTLAAKDVNSNPLTNGGLTVAFRHSGGTSTGNLSATTDNGDGTYTATFTAVIAGTATDIIGSIGGVDVTTAAPSVTVTPSATFGYVFEGFDTDIVAGDTVNFTVAVKDGVGNVITNYEGTISFSSSDAQATLPADYTFTLGDAGVKAFAVTLRTAGVQVVDAADMVDPTIDGSQTGIDVDNLPASQLGFVGPAAAKAGLCSDALDVTAQDSFDNPVTVASNVTVDLSGAGAGAFYSYDTCATPTTTVVIAGSTASTPVYFKSNEVESLTLIAEDQGAVLTDANYDFAVEPYQAWIGASSAASWFGSTGDVARGRLDEQLNVPTGSAFDGSGYFYVVDGTNHRLMKYDATDGSFVGWTGRVSATPTGGDAGCSSTPANSTTPGWCTGGRATSGAGNGQFNLPQSILISGTNAYLADGTNNRIVRYDLTTGLFSGWIGKILTSPNGGDAGCAGAAVGTFTPGWCMGGTAATGTTGTGNGHFNAPRALVTDGTSLYVADASNHRIQRFNLASGAFTGWIGRVNASPTGGDPGCAGTPTDSATPGWCTGGTAKSGTGNGMMNTPRGLTYDGTYLYVADGGNHRILRITAASGAFAGWVGRINTSPTGGGAGCAGAAGGTYTPHWCTGGTARTGTGNGHMNTPYHIHTNGTHLIVVDYTNQRLTKLNVSNGAFQGWVGRVLTSPTGGQPGCAGAPVNSVTPGWCTAGTSSYGAAAGSFYNMQGLDGDATHVYAADSSNHRIVRYSIATGAMEGWVGARADLTNGWAQSSPRSILSGYGDQQFNVVGGAHVQDGMLYVADTSNHRVQRFAVANGAYSGWIGNNWTPPTGGDAGCAAVAANLPTPGWCTGGNSRSGTGNGQLNAPQGVHADASHLYVLDSTNHRVIKYNVTTGVNVGWIGRINTSPNGGDAGCNGAAVNAFTPGWCRGGSSKSGTGDGHMSTPTGIAGDATYLYVSDGANNRIQRFNKATGAFGGWVGRIATSPTGGGAGCAGGVVGTYTAGWCTGGTAAAGTADGNLSGPRGLSLDATHIYVASATNHRVTKHAISNGAFGGWIGRINTSPTGGDAGCAGAAVNSFTPGWCTGGTAKSGNADGHMNGPRGVSVTSNGLYVVDAVNNRINKYDVSTGAFGGWSGAIATLPTGGADGCTDAAISDMTPGWCLGGTAKAGMGLGMFDSPADVTADDTYLYVTDVNNARVTRVPQ